MPAQLKKLNTYNEPFWKFILSPKRLAFLAISAFIFTGFLALRLQTKVFATTGINQTINFQGKVVNKDGTNVADGQYTFVFKLYDASSGGANPWTETQNNVQVTAGIFRVSLGSVTPITGVDFNTDNIYLGINFNSDGEMTPRVRFASVPYAFNALKVAGLTVTDTTGTLTIPNSKTVQFGGAFTTSAQDLTLTLAGSTNVTLPTTGTLATLGGVENLSNKTFTSTVAISGVTTDITTGTNEALTITPNGTGNVLINPSAGGQAALIVDKNGLGDIFSASVSGTTKFVLDTNGSILLPSGQGIDTLTANGTLNLGATNTQNVVIGNNNSGSTLTVDIGLGGSLIMNYNGGPLSCAGNLNSGKLTANSSGHVVCADDISGGGGGDNFWQYNSSTGIVANGNLTTDLLLGSTATASAKFAVLGIAAGTNPTASVSATSGSNNGNGIVIAGDGSIQSLRNNTLTLGGNTTGNITISPQNGAGTVTVNGTLAAKTSGGATIVVAASNSSAKGKAQADYVATGTNDDVTIESAIAALPATGGSVVLLDGTYNIGNAAGDGIDITKSNVSIIGSGKATILKRQGDTATNDGVIAATSVSRIAIADLAIDGTKATYTGTQNRGIYFSSAVTNSQIRNTYIHDNDGTGIYVDSSSNNNTFKDNDLQSNGEYGGIVIVSSNSNIISGNNLQSNTTYGIWLVASTNNTVTGNNVQSNTGTGIEMFNGANNNIVTGNTLQSNTQIGISIDTANNNSITGNKLYDNTGSGSNSSIVLATADANTIANNDITDTAGTGYAINISNSASDNNYVTGNRYSGTGAANISDSGTGTMLASQLANSGNDLILNAARYLGIGTATPTSVLSVVGGTMGGNAAVILNQTGSSTNDIFAASSSGTTKFVIKNDGTASTSGNLVINSTGSLQTTNNQTLTLGGSSTGDIVLKPRNGSGFVGIGNASPAYPLDLLSTTNPQVRFGYDTSNYMTLQIGSSGVTTFDAVGSGAAFNFKDTVSLGVSGASNGILQFNNSAGGTAASITTNASGDLILQSSGGIVNLGVGSGDITIDPGTNNIVANLTSGNFYGQKNGTSLISLSTSGTLPVASFSGTTSFAGLLVDNSGVGNLFTASTSGLTRFTITNNGTASSSAGFTIDGNGGNIQSTRNQSLTIGGGSTGELTIGRTSQRVFLPGFDCSGSGNGGKLTTTAGGVLTCAADGGSSGAAGTWTLDGTNGIHTPINNTADLLVGGTSTQSAMFSVLGIAAGTNPSASVSAINGANANKGIYMAGDGSLQSVRNNFLTLGGNTTGDIYLKPLNGAGMVRIIHGTTGTGGLMLGDSETDATQKAARLKSIPYNSASSLPISMLIAINSSTNNVLNIGGGSSSEYAVTDVYIKTATTQTTTVGTTRFYVGGASGFVGIGDTNTSPVARLDILDNATDINGEKLVLRRTGAGDVGLSFQQNGISAFGIVNRSGSGNGLAFVDNYYEGSNGTEIARFYASSGVGIGTLGNTPVATLDVRGVFANSGTQPVASFSGTTSFAGLIVDNSGVGDLFTASTSGLTRFVLQSNGVASASGGFTINNAGSLQTTKGQTLTIGGNSTGDISFKPGNSSTSLYLASTGAIGVNGSFGALGQCLLSNGAGAAASWGGCAAGAAGGWFNLISSQGTIVPVNQTLDLLWGGNSTASAGFRISGATKNYGTVAAASVSANTSFAGMVIDNRGTGELLTASSSGQTRFTIYNSGNVVIGNGGDSGFRLDVKGSVRIGNNTTTDDIVKDSSVDFTQSGYAITTNDSVNTVSTSENQIKLVTDLIGAGASLTAPAADQTTGTNVTTGSVAFQRPDKKFVVFVGGAATSKMYDPTTGTWIAGPSTAGAVSMGAGARAFQRQNGSFLVIHGGAATSTTVYSSGGSANLGTAIAGPATTAAVGAGSQIIRRPDGKILVIHGNTSTTSSVHDPVTATGTTSLIGTFITGPATTGNVVAGSFVFQRPDGKWILGLGGSTTTNLYDPSSSGVGGGGAFSAGPSLSAGAPAAGTHVIQLPDGRFMVLVGGSTATQIYDWKSNSFSAGSTMTVTIGAGAHSFQRSDGKWVVVAGGNSTSLMLYDPTSGADGTFSNLASGLSAAAGAGALTFQRPDGKYIVVHGNTVQTTTLYDAGWNTTGTWTSEDILNTKISTYSAMIWSANPQSANNNARLDSETINIAVKTGDTLTSLGNNPYRTLQDSGDLIKAYGNSQYAKIQVTFTVPIRSYPGGATAYLAQSNIWDGEGGTFLRRSFIQPTVFSMRIQNPLVSYGDPSGQGDPAFGRNFATASAQLEGVGTDNSNRLTLLTLRNQPTSTASAGIIIASASANLGGNAGAGAHTIERNNGQFLTILGGGTTTTRTYDSDTNTWSAGPDLPNAAGAGAHSFLLPDGRFFVVLGNTTNKTAIFDPQTSLFLAGPNLFGNVGTGANSFQRPDGYFVILNGGATPATNILDPFTMTVTQGPFTAGATPNVGAGALNIKRSDGRVTIILGNGNAIATGTNVYDPASNSFAAGPALVGGTVNTGGSAIQINTGRILLFKSTATSNWYDPVLNTFAAGPTPTANGAGAFVIPRSDGKIFKANGGNAATTNIIDPQSGVAVTATSAPTLPCNINTGAHTFQRPTGEYVVICGGSTANTLVIDAGWNLGGTYTTEQIQVPNLSSTSSLFWKNVGQGSITVKYRTAASQQALGVSSWKDLPKSGSYISPAAGDTWIQARFDLQGVLQDLPGAKTRVWNGSDAGGGMVYYRSVQAPILEYWKLINIQDPTLLTLSSGGDNVFRFSSDGQAYTSDNGAWNSGGADLAERYQSQDSLVAGEVVSLDRFHPQNTRRATTAYDQNAMGVVSTQPGFVAGAYTENSYPIALVGRVPVKVSNENGEIHAGDYLTSASIPGYAMKATVAGRVIGQAMESFDSAQDHGTSNLQDCPKFGAGNLTATRCGTITVFVNLTSYNGESVDVAMKENGYALKEEELPAISGMDFSEGTDARRQQEVLGFLKTQKDNGQSIYTDRIAATQEVISPQIVTDLLVAKKIKAESIEGLEIITNSIERLTDQVGTGSAIQNFSDRLTMLSLTQKDFETQVSSLSAKLDKISSLNLLSFIAQGSTSGELTMVNNFASYGTTTLSEASVMNTITIGTGSTLNLSNNSLYTLGDDLSIQPFRQGGVNFLGGLISFDTDGKAVFKEDVTFEKNVGVAGVLSAKTVASTELQLGQGTTTVISDTEVTATAAAGLVTLKKNTDHVKVNNPLVRDNSFIFITPKTKTVLQLFLLDQAEGTSFTVGVDGKSTEDIKFNYLIVN